MVLTLRRESKISVIPAGFLRPSEAILKLDRLRRRGPERVLQIAWEPRLFAGYASDRLSAERAQIVADVRAEAERLGMLARDYRGLFDAATTTAGTADQTLQTFAGAEDPCSIRRSCSAVGSSSVPLSP